MRILVNDFGGYAFPAALSRTLAARGHTVRHAFCGSLPTTPQAALERRPDDAPGLSFARIALPRPLDKSAYYARWQGENAYGKRIAAEAAAFAPEVVLSANTPLDAQQRLWQACRARGIPFVFWVQDLIGVATDRILRRKLPLVGAAVGAYYRRRERVLLGRSDHVVAITPDFTPFLDACGVAPERRDIVENWAPLADLPLRPRDNPWAAAHGLAGRRVFLYAGTLGMKHNPELLVALARACAHAPDVRVAAASQGLGADYLRAARERERLANLVVLPFQPPERLPDVLASADVLVSILEPEASEFSVPSKVLSYLCAGRALLLGVPSGNLAARIVAAAEAGAAVSPTDAAGFTAAARALMDDPARREACGRRARRYAEAAFDAERIADRFEEILRKAAARRSPPGPR